MELRRRRISDSEKKRLIKPSIINNGRNDENPNGDPTNDDNSTKWYLQTFYELTWQYIAQFWEEIRKRLIGYTAPDIDLPTKQKMTEFQKYVSIAFDPQDPGHMSELYLLWKKEFPDVEIPDNLESELWKKLGFQSENPLRDFRGSGIFGLKNMLFFAEKYPKCFSDLVDIDQSREGEQYPFAVASFNVTMMLFELLGWGWKTPGKSTVKDPAVYHRLVSFLFSADYSIDRAENIFNELFSVLMVKVDAKWYEMKAGYMDFPKVLTQSQLEMERLVLQFNSLEDIFAYNRVHLS